MTTMRDRDPTVTTDETSLTPEKIYTIVDAVASIGKFATLAALDQTPNDFVSSIEICRRVDKAQGPYPGWRFSKESPTIPYTYCSHLLSKLGMVEMGETEGGRGPVRGARITPQGSELWPAIAGAYLPWQDENPDILMGNVIGHPKQALETGVSTRIRILEYFLDRPDDTGARTQEIAQVLDIPAQRASTAVMNMARVGLLSYQARIALPEERTFVINNYNSPELSAGNINRMSKEMRALILSIQAADYDIGTSLNGLTIVEMAKETSPDIDSHALWARFRMWINYAKRRQSDDSFLIELPSKPHDSKTSVVTLPDDKQVPLRDFLEKRNKLATDPNFRDEMTKIGKSRLKNKEYVKRTFRDAKRDTHMPATKHAEWELLLLELIPIDGIDIDTLYDSTQKDGIKTINRKSFAALLSELDDLVEISVGRYANGINMKPYVRWRDRTFPANWQDFARCKQPDVDPDVFIPLDDEPKHIRSSKIAQAVFHCTRCHVRPACLKDALENDEQDGVWGGLSPKQLKAIRPPQKQKVLEIINIGTHQAEAV